MAGIEDKLSSFLFTAYSYFQQVVDFVQNIRGQRKVAAILISIATILFFIETYTLIIAVPHDVHLTRTLFNQTVSEVKTLEKISPETDKEWVDVLKNGNIISIKPIQGEVSGLGEKWLIHLEGGYKAMVKPVQSWGLFTYQWDIKNIWDNTHLRPKRADRKVQGWGEIAAFYLDRTLRLYRKPPIVGRYISSKLLYSYAFKNDKDIVWTSYDAFTWIKYLLPEQAIPVSVHAWMDGIHKTPPALEFQSFLTIANNVRSFNVRDKLYASDISDTIVFDFLIDDHDRREDYNWVSDAQRNLLLWDSGLAFNHGPFGRPECFDIMCGPTKWVEKFTAKNITCQPICRFRNSTISLLYEMYHKQTNNLGEQLRLAIAQDTLYPIFQYNLYYVRARLPKKRFDWQNFFSGLDVKLSKLIQHVEMCIQKFGRERVILYY